MAHLMNKQRNGNFFNQESLKGWAAILLLLLVAALSIYRQSPPDAVLASAPPDQFSSGRALEHLKLIAASPRPVGSAEHDGVRDYLLRELGRLGLEAQTQKATGINARQPDSILAATVQNVVGRIRGTGVGGKAVMLVAHYDSVPHSFGASDDGAAVAALLETARALKTSAPLANDVIFLFTDGEECGLLGAEAFVQEHPWARDVGVVCNFEARGNRGPVYMFESSPGNHRLIQQLGAAAPRPFATSLSSDLYRLLPNDTDFTIFKAANLEGLNFAYFDGATYYHTSLDNLGELDERSLQHHGQYALALARQFGGQDLTSGGGQTDAVYFDVLSAKLVSYSKSWTLPLMILVYVLLLAVVLLGLKKKRLSVRGIALGFLAFLLNIICAVGVVWLVWRLVGGLDREYSRMHESGPYNGHFYFICFVILAGSIISALCLFFSGKLGLYHLLVGALICWAVVMTLSGLFLQGGSYLFIWPLLFMLAALGTVFLSRRKAQAVEPNELLLLSLCAVPGIVLLIPAIQALALGLGIGLIWAVVFPLVLLLGLLLAGLDFLTRKLRWWLPAALCVASLALLITASLSARFDNRHREPDSLFYVLNSDEGKAIWLSFDKQPDAFTSQFFPPGTGKSKVANYVPNMLGSFLNAQAPVAALAAPNAQVVADDVSGGVRRVRLHLASSRQAQIINIYAEPGTSILAASIKGRNVLNESAQQAAGTASEWSLQYYALEPEGLDLTLEVKPSTPLKLKVLDISYGLPALPNFAVQPRPDDIMPTADGVFYQDTTIVSTSYSF
ncbi:MAG: hypothetical protein QOF02_2081 [Blastocatellia bacterium]|jgi:hypothetical protein|nr:hypothetical protein [Blastocatellia bacterium]